MGFRLGDWEIGARNASTAPPPVPGSWRREGDGREAPGSAARPASHPPVSVLRPPAGQDRERGYTGAVTLATYSSYSSMGGHAQTRFRSPYADWIRPTKGQNLFSRCGWGKATSSRE